MDRWSDLLFRLLAWTDFAPAVRLCGASLAWAMLGCLGLLLTAKE